MGIHTVEKIGGTSISQFNMVLHNVILGDRTPGNIYNRIFVVSAYGGITDMLLENKKTGSPGVYQMFSRNDSSWEEALQGVLRRMVEINHGFASLKLDVAMADEFVSKRIDDIRTCLTNLRQLCSFGHFNLKEYLPMVREMLSAIGEAHSAFNSTQILLKHDINAVFIDLSGWKDEKHYTFEDMIRNAFSTIDFSQLMPIATGYTKCDEGIMATFDRGYSEITFSKIATVTEAREGIIHKEFHLSTGDPLIIGKDKVKVIGHTNYDVADQLADLGMEAIHPKASKNMERKNIPIRVKNAFDPNHPGTLISSNTYRSPVPRIEMVTGRQKLIAIEVWDPDMVGQIGYDYQLLAHFKAANISYITKNVNANTITHYVPAETAKVDACVTSLKQSYPTAEIQTTEVSIISVIGSNMKVPGILAKAANALAKAGINILAINHCMRQVNIQFIITPANFAAAIITLHKELVEDCETLSHITEE